MRRPARRRGFAWAPVVALLLGFSQANAVLIAGPDGSINSMPPLPPLLDPGFANVGDMSGLTGVYVRNGWVLTANHVGIGPIELDGTVYQAVPGSEIRFTNPTPPDPDLIAFKLEQRPPLPDLMLASGPVRLNQEVMMIGQGRNRAAATTWISPGSESFDGWFLGTGRAIRWGTNSVDLTDQSVDTGGAVTEAFVVSFDEISGSSSDDPEAQAVSGDSGGAVFVWNGAVSELIGIMFARGSLNPAQSTQPLNLALFENTSFMVDLDHYRSQILSVIDQPDCADGLDEDGDGLVDFPDDPGCDDAFDNSEKSAALICDNGLDDDFDQLIDFPEDDGCDDLLDPSELPEPELPVALAAGVMTLLNRARGRASRQATRRT